MVKEINTQYTIEIVCPYCGYEFMDSWEEYDSGTTECRECEKEFYFDRDVAVTYCSNKITN